MSVTADIEARITFMPTEHGGRAGPAFQRYRPQFYYDGQDWDASHSYPDNEVVNPGETVRAHLSFLSPEKHFGKVVPGMPFLIREGNRTIGYGVVVSLLNLEHSAASAQVKNV